MMELNRWGTYACPYLGFEVMTSLHPSRVDVLSCGFPGQMKKKNKRKKNIRSNSFIESGTISEMLIVIKMNNICQFSELIVSSVVYVL